MITPTPTPTPTNNVVLVLPLPPDTPISTPTPSSSRVSTSVSLSQRLQCNSNGIFNLINAEFHNVFNKAIDTLLSQGALSVPCVLRYSSPLRTDKLCTNCVYNPITNRSEGIYSGNGISPFLEGSICPVCMGKGTIIVDEYTESLDMMVIFDSKYFLNIQTKTINIPDSMAQSISCISSLPKIRNCHEAILDSSITSLTNQLYERIGEPQPVGLGENKYIITTWKKK